MGTGMVSICLLILVIIFITGKIITRKKAMLTSNKPYDDLLPTNGQSVSYKENEHITDRISPVAKLPEIVWWNTLDTLSQLRFALRLTQKALPVWENYTAANDPSYQDSPTMPLNKINAGLLQAAIDEMTRQSVSGMPASDNKMIWQWYFNFVGPVIAIRDGTWVPPYPVKKIFLSVYHILKSIMEQNNPAGVHHFLATAISQALDCLDISKLYCRDEINDFLESNKNSFTR